MLKTKIAIAARVLGALLPAAACAPANAALAIGAVAPEFHGRAAQAGVPTTFDLYRALAKGPVVLFFIPHAFTGQCDWEGHQFSDRIADFRRYGASVVAVSVDSPEKQLRWSRQVCAGKFPVVSDADTTITKAYDDLLPIHSNGHIANRTTYVIMPDRRIGFTFQANSPVGHVEESLLALVRLTANR